MQALNGFGYERSRLVLHTDERLMPRDRSQWRSVNFILDQNTLPAAAASAEHKGGAGGRVGVVRGESMATIWMNRVHHQLYRETAVNVFQTWNPIREPQPNSVLV